MSDLSGMPLVGTALPLVFPKTGRVEQPPVGSWVKMRNLGARVVDGQLQVGGPPPPGAQVGRGQRAGRWRLPAGERGAPLGLLACGQKHTPVLPTSTPVCSALTTCEPLHPAPGCQAFYHRQKSRWTPWQDEARQAELEEEYRQRLAANHTAGWAPSPRDEASELLARSRHSQRPISTVRQVG